VIAVSSCVLLRFYNHQESRKKEKPSGGKELIIQGNRLKRRTHSALIPINASRIETTLGKCTSTEETETSIDARRKGGCQ